MGNVIEKILSHAVLFSDIWIEERPTIHRGKP